MFKLGNYISNGDGERLAASGADMPTDFSHSAMVATAVEGI